ncbi:hypothetical protein KDK95_19975 [Actinospica sp. MGRD01-02]|uniref:Uncharacterized protein n=1 Tax=Actinospica acidithermotolerans TaxID=2828514 RepID=A0A941IIQ8_9ACTN|nr:hypothetical protein [Actinospica acidithermotolerans]MBR7828599.1 hypothetical protein [Actinospica acidithermotolerans]
MHHYFRDRPESIDQLFRAVGFTTFPDIVATEDLSGDVTMLDPVPRQADSVVKARTKEGDEFVLIFEAQQGRPEEKRIRWPQYVTSLHDRHEMPVVLVIVCNDRATADWAARPITIRTEFWQTCVVRPLVLGPDEVPVLKGPISDADLMLAVFGVITHGRDRSILGILEPLAKAVHQTDEEMRTKLALEIQSALIEPVLAQKWKELMLLMTTDEESMRANPVFGEVLRKVEDAAEAKGEAESILIVLEDREIEVTDAQRERILAVHDRELLRRWLRMALHVSAADELFG